MLKDSNRNEVNERVFSVTMTEEEISLFSEFKEEQKEFAKGNVAGMNPNMIRRRVVNGRTVTRTAPGKGPSIKEIKHREIESSVRNSFPPLSEKAPAPKYESNGFKTVETGASKLARESFEREKESRRLSREKEIHDKVISTKRSRRRGDRDDYTPIGDRIPKPLALVGKDDVYWNPRKTKISKSNDTYNRNIFIRRNINGAINKKSALAKKSYYNFETRVPKDHRDNLSHHFKPSRSGIKRFYEE